MDVRLLGGAREIGRSAVLVDDSLLIDFGMDSGNPPSFPIEDVDPDAVVVSHGHLDHVGSIPTLLSGEARPPIHWTSPTSELAMVLARDTLELHGGTYNCPFTETELARLTQVSETHGYGDPFEAAGYEITFFDAGHVPGSAHVLVSDGDTRLLYTGDFHTEDQQLLSGTTARPPADAVICESTYADVTRPPRAEIEQAFVDSLERTLWEGGTVVVPAFAIGRTQEMLCLCEQHDLECYVDGMGKRVTELFLREPNREFLRDPDLLRRAKGNARFVDGRDGQRKRIAEQNTVIVTTSGMLHGGPAMTYVPAVRSHPTNKIALTGHQVEGTPGRELYETGSAVIDGRSMRVSAQVEQYDFSAHADREGLLAFLEEYADAHVLVNHGDRCEEFAADLREDGFDAAAPALGDRLAL
ncbi:MBL fold metallo-hydrolase [Natronococcus occultus]|uniref:Putative exonuclease of the beta-lactamase fold involved in RNA processing n=1 Tax=Natronococcus occultus SP4 TaxID=694430 RepID=L0K1V0_9EURY|nr:MBL fold metallo-hydrolase [Natronococcus occultus]AGB38093.1 putative exonuclease of the beta-lactamase fold involved in RNA processing [Natronococcus occultus SP4]